MGWFRLAPMRHEQSSDPLIRVFQSETAEIRENPEPARLRLTLHLLAVLFLSLLAVSFFMPMDRVITSTAGQIVTIEPTIVLQALDPSIIKTLEVQAGRTRQGWSTPGDARPDAHGCRRDCSDAADC
jgi:hemolysin D